MVMWLWRLVHHMQTRFRVRFYTYNFSGLRLFSIGLFIPGKMDDRFRLNVVLWSRSFNVEVG
jgi:hypothetical protein